MDTNWKMFSQKNIFYAMHADRKRKIENGGQLQKNVGPHSGE